MKFEKPTTDQIRVAALFDLIIDDDLPEVGCQKIIDKVNEVFGYPVDLRPATKKQIDFAHKFDVDVSGYTQNLAGIVLTRITQKEDQESIARQNLGHGDIVRIRFKNDEYNKNGLDQIEYTISSIKNGMVYFKGGNGKKTSARNVRKIN